MSTNLTIFFVFALAALYFLTRTLVSTAQIDSDITKAINPATSGISTDTAMLSAFDRTGTLTDQIAKSVRALPVQLGVTAKATDGISESMARADASVASIGRSVAAIDGSVEGIRGSAVTLEPGIGQVRASAASIDSRFAEARSATESMNRDLAAANRYLRTILVLLGPITIQARAIDSHVVTIDKHAENIDNNILIDLGNILNKSSMTTTVSRVTTMASSALLLNAHQSRGAMP